MTGEVPKSTQAMFQSLMEDVEKLMTRKSQAQQEENEGRTKAMRMLRHLRDWIQVGVSVGRGGGGVLLSKQLVLFRPLSVSGALFVRVCLCVIK